MKRGFLKMQEEIVCEYCGSRDTCALGEGVMECVACGQFFDSFDDDYETVEKIRKSKTYRQDEGNE